MFNIEKSDTLYLQMYFIMTIIKIDFDFMKQ